MEMAIPAFSDGGDDSVDDGGDDVDILADSSSTLLFRRITVAINALRVPSILYRVPDVSSSACSSCIEASSNWLKKSPSSHSDDVGSMLDPVLTVFSSRYSSNRLTSTSLLPRLLRPSSPKISRSLGTFISFFHFE